MVHLPYITVLLGKLEQEGDADLRALVRHLHFGFWRAPQAAATTQEDLAVAADRLSDLVCEAAAIGDGETVLDVGCGFGGTIAQIDQRRRGVTLLGLNIDPRQLLRAATTVDVANGNVIGFVGGDACALPFCDRTFDAVIAVECSFHFADRARFLAEVTRVLKPGGRFAATDIIRGHGGLAGAAALMLMPRVLDSAFYGRVDVSYSMNDYRRAAISVGLSPLVERDITAEVDPSYPVIRRTLRKWGCRRASAEAALGRWLSRHGVIRYVLLAFTKA